MGGATVAKTGYPKWARRMWYDAEAIYLEMPVVGHPPIIMKFDWTDAGLNKALNFMKVTYDKAGPHREKNGWKTDHDVIKRERAGQLPKPRVGKESRSLARDILKKLGMIS